MIKYSRMKSDFMRAASLGLEIAVSVFLGAGVGYGLDHFFNTSPWLMVVGLVLGSIAGFWNAFRFAMSEDERT